MRAYYKFSAAIFAAAFIFTIFMPQRLLADDYEYRSKGRRDPFIPLIGSGITTALGLEVVETVEDVKFEGVIFDPYGESMAMLNGEVVKEGYRNYNVEVLKIYNDAVTIRIYHKVYTVHLAKEGGETVER